MYQYLKTPATCGAAVVLGLGLSAAPADAVPVSYNSRVAFDAAAGPLAGFEDFEDLTPIFGDTQGPWDSDTDDEIVDPGDIAEGVAFDGTGGDLLAVAPPEFGFSSIAVGATFFSDELDILFEAGVNAVGLDILHADEGYGLSDITVSLFDMDDAWQGRLTAPPGPSRSCHARLPNRRGLGADHGCVDRRPARDSVAVPPDGAARRNPRRPAWPHP